MIYLLGCSAALEVFSSIGPQKLLPDLTFAKNNFAYNNEANVLIVDAPAGAGYSTVSDPASLCGDRECYSKEFYDFLVKFVENNPKYSYNPLFMTGVG